MEPQARMVVSDHDGGVLIRPRPNLPLIRKVLAQIDDEPDSWTQGTYGAHWDSPSGLDLIETDNRKAASEMSCGTAYCFAGHAALMTGWHPEHFDHTGDASMTWIRENDHTVAFPIEAIARRELGLTPEEGADLFAAENTRADLERICQRIAVVAGEEL
jgi:hypothetical protein